MPHFIVDCSEEILVSHSIDTILKYLHQVAHHTELFDEKDIKVRINPYKTAIVGNKKQAFIHVFAHIMEGRSDEEKANLSAKMVKRLSIMFPSVENIAMNVSEFAKASYCNLAMLKPEPEAQTEPNGGADKAVDSKLDIGSDSIDTLDKPASKAG